jgi:hypothetical protein
VLRIIIILVFMTVEDSKYRTGGSPSHAVDEGTEQGRRLPLFGRLVPN